MTMDRRCPTITLQGQSTKTLLPSGIAAHTALIAGSVLSIVYNILAVSTKVQQASSVHPLPYALTTGADVRAACVLSRLPHHFDAATCHQALVKHGARAHKREAYDINTA